MYKSIQERASGSAGQGNLSNGLVNVERPIGWSAEKSNLYPSEAYRPCEGTWQEFVCDVKAFFARMKADISGRFEDVRDSMRRVFRRNES